MPACNLSGIRFKAVKKTEEMTSRMVRMMLPYLPLVVLHRDSQLSVSYQSAVSQLSAPGGTHTFC